MLAAPVLVGAWPRFSWWHAVLAAAAVAAFLALYADGLWLKSGRKRRYRGAAVTYTLLAAVLVGVLVATHPRLLAWAWVYLPGLALSLWAHARRDDRSWWNDAILVGLSCVATMVAAGLRPAPGGGPSPAAGSGDWFAWPPPGAQAPDARIAAIVLFVYFFGTVAHVRPTFASATTPPSSGSTWSTTWWGWVRHSRS